MAGAAVALLSTVHTAASNAPPLPPGLSALQAYRDAGYLECPLVRAETAWSCWRTNPERADRLLGWTWADGRWHEDRGARPTFDGTAFLRAHVNGTIVFVGDSLVRQQFVSLACLLWREGHFLQQHPTVLEPGLKKAVFSARYRLRLVYVKSNFLVPRSGDSHLVLNRLDASITAAVALDPQVLLLSTGHWFTPRLVNVSSEAAVLPQLRGALRQVRSLLRRKLLARWRLRGSAHTLPGRVVVRTMPPRHFFGGEWDTGGVCNFPAPLGGRDASWADASLRRDRATARALSQEIATELGGLEGVEILEVQPSSRARADAHIGGFRCPKCLALCKADAASGKATTSGLPRRCSETIADCSHYCLPGLPDLWNAQLQTLLQAPPPTTAATAAIAARTRRSERRSGWWGAVFGGRRLTAARVGKGEQRRRRRDQRLMLCTESASRVQRWSVSPRASSVDSCPLPYRRVKDDLQPGRTESLCCSAERTPSLRLETCDGRVHTLPELTPWLRGRTVALVGDSLLNHLYVEWSRRIGAVEPKAARGDGGGGRPLSRDAVLQASLAHWCAQDTARAPERESFSLSHNVTLLKYSMHRRETARCNASADPTRRWLEGPAGGDRGGGRIGSLRGYDVDLSMLDAAMARADVIIVNLGVHWRDGHQRHYRRAVRAVLEQIKAANRRGDGGDNSGGEGVSRRSGNSWPVALYKQSTPQHFASTDGSGYYEKRRRGEGPGARGSRCAPLGASRPSSGNQWRTAIEAEEASAVFGDDASDFVVPTFGALAARWDGHTPPDCTHACFEPALWDGMFDPFVRLLRNRLVERAVHGHGHGHGRRYRHSSARAWGCANLPSTTCRPALTEALPHGAAPLVPRIIHQTHKSGLFELPAGLRAAIATWDELNPDFEHVYYPEAAMRAYVRQRGEMVEGFAAAYAKATSGAMRCDLWRYLLLWAEGGVYADADSLLQRPLSEVIRDEDEALTGFGQDGLEQFVMAYRPRHPIILRTLKQAIAAVLRLPPFASGLEVLTHTGPLQLCAALKAELQLGQGVSERGWCLAAHHMAPQLATGLYGEPQKGNSIRVLSGHYACHASPPPPRGAPPPPTRMPWAAACAIGIEHCPCVWRDESELVVNGKYNMSQYQLDLQAMSTPYYASTMRRRP